VERATVKAARFWELEDRTTTIAFWLAVGAFSLAYFVTRFPPCVDYPQHLAMGALLHRLWQGSPENADFVWDLHTYNGGFHVLIALLSYVMRPELAGKLVLAALPMATAAVTLEVLRLGERPRWLAFLILPFCFSNVVGWGFINYALGVPLGMYLLCAWVRWCDGERRRWPVIVLGSLLLAFTHVLAMLCFCVSVLVAWLARARPAELGVVGFLRASLVAAAPFVPALAWSLSVHQHHRSLPNIYWEDKDGQDSAAWEKLQHLGRYAVGNVSGNRDQWIFWLGLGLLLLLFALPWLTRSVADGSEPRARRREWVALGVVWALAYLLVPRILMSTWFIFERLPVWAMTFALPLVPTVGERFAQWLRPAAMALGLMSAATVFTAFTRIPDGADADAILDDIPAGARVFAVMHDSGGEPGVWRRLFVHHLAYYVARRPGEIAYTFTKFASLPVRYRTEVRPPLIPGGLEWTPWDYRVTAEYARRYPWVLVRTSARAPDRDPAAQTFGVHASEVRVVSRRGRFWLYDVSRIWTDPELEAAPAAPPSAPE
jgi:hypothetical protein